MKVLETDRVVLSWLSPDDAPFILELLNDSSWLHYIGDKGIRTLEDARGYIVDGPIQMYESHGFGLYKVELKEEGTPLGICGLIKRDSLQHVDIGFAFLTDYHSMGYAKEAAAATLAFGHNQLGRSWQCGTVQLDFQMPEKFDCHYIDEDNKPVRPIMIHRAIYGSIERFMAILIEHYAGDFPVWLAPIQAKVLPISDAHSSYANQVMLQLQEAGIRVELDDRVEKIGLKIREAELQKVPYMFIIGDKEMENETLAVRKRLEGNLGDMKLLEVIGKLKEDIHNRK